jgi:phthalate 4,5-dioxygenase oxygenase subunit
MGPIVDRRFEHLSSTDLTLVRFRKGMLDALRSFEQGEGVWGRPQNPAAYSRIRTEVLDVPAGASWRGLVTPD